MSATDELSVKDSFDSPLSQCAGVATTVGASVCSGRVDGRSRTNESETGWLQKRKSVVAVFEQHYAVTGNLPGKSSMVTGDIWCTSPTIPA
jgi:hypothetical protein